MTRIKTRDGGDQGVFLDYLEPNTVVTQETTASSVAVTLATIAATDIVFTQLLTNSTVTSHINYVAITAGTGFTAYLSALTVFTLGYSVYHPNA